MLRSKQIRRVNTTRKLPYLGGEQSTAKNSQHIPVFRNVTSAAGASAVEAALEAVVRSVMAAPDRIERLLADPDAPMDAIMPTVHGKGIRPGGDQRAVRRGRLMRVAAVAVERAGSMLTNWMAGNGQALIDPAAAGPRRSWR